MSVRVGRASKCFAIGLVTCLIVAGCGGSENTPTVPPAAATATPAPAARATPTPAATPAPTQPARPKQSGTLRVALSTIRDEGFHPALTVADQIFVYHDFMFWRDKAGGAVPGIVKEWRLGPDVKELELKLNKGVKFTDGVELTAEDLKFTFGTKLFKNRRGQSELMAKWVGSESNVVVVDRYTVLVHGQVPFATVVASLSTAGGSNEGIVLPKHLLAGTPAGTPDAMLADIQVPKQMVGAGPWIFSQYSPKESIEFTAVAPDWNGLAPHRTIPEFQRLRHSAVPEPSTRLALLRTGGTDITSVSYVDVGGLRNNPGVKVYKGDNSKIVTLNALDLAATGENNPQYPLSYQKVREGLAKAIDVKTLLDVTGNLGTVVPPFNFIPGMAGYDPKNPEMAAPSVKYDPEGAVRLFKEAGFEPGKIAFKVVVAPRPGTEYIQDVGEAIFSMWKQIGVKPEVVSLEYSAFAKHNADKNPAYFAAFLLWGVNVRYEIRQSGLAFVAHSKTGLRSGAWPDVDRKIEGCLAATTPEQVLQLCQDASIAIKDRQYVFSLFTMPVFLASHTGTVGDMVFFDNDDKMVAIWESVKHPK